MIETRAAPDVVLDPQRLERLRVVAESVGVLRLGAVDLEHPALQRAADAFDDLIARGRHGSMDFLARGRAVRRSPQRMLAGARTAVVGVVPYGGIAGPIARYAQFDDYHTVLHRRLQALEDGLRREVGAVETLICVDTKPVMERAVAATAGLGFLGKNGCLIVPGLGSYVLIGVILTSARWGGPGHGTGPEDVRAPMETDACGSCRRCLDACPTQAFDGPGQLDPRRCIAYLTIEERAPIPDALADRLGQRVAGCDKCQEVCPYNAAHERPLPSVAQVRLPGERDVPDPALIAVLGSARYRAFVRGTALTRIPRRSLRRNALLAVGNGRGLLTVAEQHAVESGLHDSDPQIRAAAQRAQRRRNGATNESA